MTLVRKTFDLARQVEPGLAGLKLIDGSTGACRISLLRGRLQPGAIHSPHTHDVEESVVFLSGTGVVEIGGLRSEIQPGDAILVAPGVIHSTFNTGSEDLWFVAAYPSNQITANTDPTGSSKPTIVHWSGVRNRIAWALRRVADRISA